MLLKKNELPGYFTLMDSFSPLAKSLMTYPYLSPPLTLLLALPPGFPSCGPTSLPRPLALMRERGLNVCLSREAGDSTHAFLGRQGGSNACLPEEAGD